MNIDDQVFELQHRKAKAEAVVISVVWAHPWYWHDRAAALGITGGAFDDWCHRAAWEVSRLRSTTVIGHWPAERLLVKLIDDLDLDWEPLEMRSTIWRLSPGEAAKVGDMAFADLIDCGERMWGVRQGMTRLRQATDWTRPYPLPSRPPGIDAGEGWMRPAGVSIVSRPP